MRKSIEIPGTYKQKPQEYKVTRMIKDKMVGLKVYKQIKSI